MKGELRKGSVIRLQRPGVRACGPWRHGVEYTVGEEGGPDLKRAENLVRVKGFRVVRGSKSDQSEMTDQQEE